MLHLGGARTALFNYLFARRWGGDFLLRIEDTDRARFQEEALEDITKSLQWLGLQWDEGVLKGGECGPYFQSERLDIYKKYVDELLKSGHAYKCYCSEEELAAQRKEAEEKKLPVQGYDGRCSRLTPEEIAKYEAEGRVPTVRFKMPKEGVTVFTDAIRGEVSYQNDQQTDFIILKADGYPTYHLANIVDDHLMGITHVMRGDEWISSTPKHICLYNAFGWEPPVFAHLPVILKPGGGGKLSKRDGDVSVFQYRDKGYLPEALVNFLALLGWAYSETQEIVSVDEMIKAFSLDHINKAGAQFHVEKLNWMNGEYIRKLTVEDLTERCWPYLVGAGLVKEDRDKSSLHYIMSLLQPRLVLLTDVVDMISYFLKDEIEYNEADVRKILRKEGVRENLAALRPVLAENDFTPESLNEAIHAFMAANELSPKKVMQPLRVAVTGRSCSPGMFETLYALGKEKALKRLDYAVSSLTEPENA
jgi:glutamyl-tRNA synthetase